MAVPLRGRPAAAGARSGRRPLPLRRRFLAHSTLLLLLTLLASAVPPVSATSRPADGHARRRLSHQLLRLRSPGGDAAVAPPGTAFAELSAGASPPLRRLQDFRMSIGAATFTDPDGAADDPFESVNAGAPRAVAAPPPAPAAVNRAGPAVPAQRPAAAANTLELPRCYFSEDMNRCFLNPFYPLAYAPPPEDPVARFEMKLIVRGFSCWRHTTASSCAAERGGECRWLSRGGDAPTAKLWNGLGRPCVLDEAVQNKAVQQFYLCPGSKVQRYVSCAAADSVAACKAFKGCAWSDDTAYDNSTLSYIIGAINDTLSWTTVRPLGVLPLDARCRPYDVAFEDGEAASGPPMEAAMWGDCNTVRRLNGGSGACDATRAPVACPPLEGPVYEHWLYGGMLRRTHKLLGSSVWSRQYVSDWWACDSQAGSAAGCAGANVTSPVYTERRGAASGKPGPAVDSDQPVVDPGLLNEPLLGGDRWGARRGSQPLPADAGGGGAGGAASSGAPGAARPLAMAAAAAVLFAAALA